MNLNGIEIVEKKAEAPGSNTLSPTKIKVVGCGGCGGNAVDTMIDTGVGGVEFIAINTDLQALTRSKAEYKIQIGQKLAGGLGAGGKPEVGEESAIEQKEQIQELLKGSDMVFITAGMGGGTGTGSAPVVAKIARELGALTVAVVTTPFKFEGKVRMEHADEGVKKLRAEVDSLIAIPNELILQDKEKRLSVPKAFVLINDILRQGVQGISDIITKPGLVNRDFRDVESVMKDQGDAILGIGEGTGDNRAVDAAHNAINNRLLVDTNIDGAKNVLINIAGNSEVAISECNEIATIITERANPNAVVLWGQVLDETMEDRISVTVIATGFNSSNKEAVSSATEKTEKKMMSDTMSDDEFMKVIKKPVNAAAPQPTVPQPAPIFMQEQKEELTSEVNPAISDLGFNIYEEKGNGLNSSLAMTAMNSAPATKNIFEETQRPAENRYVSQAASMVPPSNLREDMDDKEIPAVWRKTLDQLPGKISLKKK